MPLVRNAGAVFVGADASAVIGDYVAGVNHVLADRRHRAVPERAARRRLPQARARRSLDADASRAARAVRHAARRRRGTARATPTRSGCGSDRERADVRTGAAARRSAARSSGYHSPQVDVDVRLNTNESPYAPPAEFVAAGTPTRCATFAGTAIPTAARADLRDALGAFLGQPRERAPLRERQQRGAADAAAHLRRTGPARA